MPSDKSKEAVDLLIPKGKMLTVQEGDYVRKGDMLLDGNPVPHDILRILGLEKLGRVALQLGDDVRAEGIGLLSVDEGVEGVGDRRGDYLLKIADV